MSKKVERRIFLYTLGGHSDTANRGESSYSMLETLGKKEATSMIIRRKYGRTKWF